MKIIGQYFSEIFFVRQYGFEGREMSRRISLDNAEILCVMVQFP
jgi:hypothetical protein